MSNEERDEQAAINEQYDGIDDHYQDHEKALDEARAGFATEVEAMDAYEKATGHTFEPIDATDNGPCKEYDAAGSGAGTGADGQPVCASCGFDLSEHSTRAAVDSDTMTPEERTAAEGLRSLLTPERMSMPVLLNQELYTTPEGSIMCRYTFGFVNQLGQMIAAVGPNNGRVLATVVFSNDTGRRTLATNRPRPGDIARGRDFRNGLGR